MDKTAAPDFLDILNESTANLLRKMMLNDVEFGRVSKVNPLEIMLDSKKPLPAAFLTLTNAVKDHAVDITVSWSTVSDDYLKTESTLYAHTHKGQNYVGNSGKPLAGESDPMDILKYNTTHHHDIKGRKRIIVHNGLTVGERVILLRKQGGQDYIVLDRVDEPKTTGESI